MTIRYQCDACESVLKIEDRKAGTEQKCPKCKKKFIVPNPEPVSDADSSEHKAASDETVVAPARPKKSSEKAAEQSPAEQPAAKETSPPPEPSRKTPEKSPEKKPADDFDAIMDEELGPPAKKGADQATAKKPSSRKEADDFDAIMDEELGASSSKPKSKEANVQEQAKPAEDDFDAAAFLMEGNSGPNKPSAGLTAEPQEPRKGPSWARGGRRPIMPVEETGQGGSGGGGATAASANARDLLTKSMEESRIRAASLPPEKTKEPFLDLTGATDELKRRAPLVVGAVVGVIFLYLSVNWMLSDKVWLPELGRVRGKVTIEGKPYANLQVTLSPVVERKDIGGGKTQTVGSSQGVTDEEGYFEAVYPGGYRGAPVGKVRVLIEPVIATPEMIRKIPRAFADGKSTMIEVKKTGNDENFIFDLKPGQ